MIETIAPSDQEKSSQTKPAVSTEESVDRRKFIRNISTLIIVVSAVVLTLYVWGMIERHPRTDDAAARANVVGIVPRVRG